MAITFVSSHGAGVTSGVVVNVTSVPSGTNRLYIVAGGSKDGDPRISSISGGGLSWIDLQDQCGGRNQTMVDVWYAIGSPVSSFTVVVTFDSIDASLAALVDVYDGADPTTPVLNESGENTNGPGGACSGGTDDDAANIQTTIDTPATSVAWNVCHHRNRDITIDGDFTERGFATANSGGDQTQLTSSDRFDPVASESADHSLSGVVDWSMVALEIQETTGPVEKVGIDTIGLEINEVQTLLLSQADPVDTVGLEVNEVKTDLFSQAEVQDNLDLDAGEVAELLGIIQPVDTTGLTVDEATEVLGLMERLDTLGISFIEVAEVLVAIADIDSLDLEVNEVEFGLFGDIQVTDTMSLLVGEPSALLVLLDRADTLALILGEQADLLALLERIDDVDLAIVEAPGSVQVPINAADTLNLAVVEGVGDLLSLIQRTDLLSLSVDETAQIIGFLNRSDILNLNISEQADLVVVITAADTLDVAIDDVVDDLVVVLTAADNLGISISEVAQIFRAISVVDTLGLAIDEVQADRVEVTTPFQGILVQTFRLTTTKAVRFRLQIEGSGVQE